MPGVAPYLLPKKSPIISTEMFQFESIRGVLPNSLLDWPGKICAVLFLGGCNFRCPYCHNPELMEMGGTPESISWDDLRLFLKERTGWLDGVSITGGEPTIHADLPHLCHKIRDQGMKVKLDTNGSNPRMLRQILSEGLLDYVSMDLKTSFEKYFQVVRRPVDPDRIRESMEVIISCGVEHEFRSTIVPGLVELSDLRSLAMEMMGAQVLVLQQFRSDKTMDPHFTGRSPYPEEVLLDWADELTSFLPTKVRGLVGVSRG